MSNSPLHTKQKPGNVTRTLEFGEEDQLQRTRRLREKKESAKQGKPCSTTVSDMDEDSQLELALRRSEVEQRMGDHEDEELQKALNASLKGQN